jgi:hypothetical protein
MSSPLWFGRRSRAVATWHSADFVIGRRTKKDDRCTRDTRRKLITTGDFTVFETLHNEAKRHLTRSTDVGDTLNIFV